MNTRDFPIQRTLPPWGVEVPHIYGMGAFFIGAFFILVVDKRVAKLLKTLVSARVAKIDWKL